VPPGAIGSPLSPGAILTLAADAVVCVCLAPRCASCDALLETPLAGAVCEACWRAICPITPPVCDRCGDPLPAWRAVSRERACCPRCRRTARAVDRGRAVGEYDGTLRQIIHALKYDGRRSLARGLGALMRRAGADLLDGADWVMPVPLHRRRQRVRGFNQARDLAGHLGPPVLDALERIRHTRPQIELPAPRRHANVRDAFAVRIRRSWSWRRRSPRLVTLAGACVVLVDDVSTTGATLDACARVLKRAGAREVRALTAARVVARPR
jgi:ComF family protein